MLWAKSFSIVAILSVTAVAGAADEPTVGGKTKAEWLKILREDKDAPKRSEAVAALSVFPGKQRDRAMTDAVAQALLTDKSVRVRLRAVDGCAAILGTSEREERTVVEALGKAMSNDTSESVRLAAGERIKELKTTNIRTLAPVLADVLRGDKSPAVRVVAAVALSKATESAGTVLKAMMEALKDPEPSVRIAVAESLGRLGDEAKGAVPALKPLLKDADAGVRLSAAFALGRIGPEGATAVPELSAALASDTDTSVRKEAARAFSLLGLDAKAAVPALAKALREDKSEEVRQQAALALSKMIGETRDVAPVMIEAMKKDTDKNVRVFIVHALGDSLGDGLRAYVKDLAARLMEGAEPEADVKLAIIQELGALGPGAKEALPALNRAITDVQLSVRDAAKQAVKKVMGK
jgi:HEAT repeat protein